MARTTRAKMPCPIATLASLVGVRQPGPDRGGLPRAGRMPALSLESCQIRLHPSSSRAISNAEVLSMPSSDEIDGLMRTSWEARDQDPQHAARVTDWELCFIGIPTAYGQEARAGAGSPCAWEIDPPFACPDKQTRAQPQPLGWFPRCCSRPSTRSQPRR